MEPIFVAGRELGGRKFFIPPFGKFKQERAAPSPRNKGTRAIPAPGEAAPGSRKQEPRGQLDQPEGSAGWPLSAAPFLRLSPACTEMMPQTLQPSRRRRRGLQSRPPSLVERNARARALPPRPEATGKRGEGQEKGRVAGRLTDRCRRLLPGHVRRRARAELRPALPRRRAPASAGASSRRPAPRREPRPPAPGLRRQRHAPASLLLALAPGPESRGAEEKAGRGRARGLFRVPLLLSLSHEASFSKIPHGLVVRKSLRLTNTTEPQIYIAK